MMLSVLDLDTNYEDAEAGNADIHSYSNYHLGVLLTIVLGSSTDLPDGLPIFGFPAGQPHSSQTD